MFYVFYDDDLENKENEEDPLTVYSRIWQTHTFQVCAFDANLAHQTSDFFIGTLNKERVCYDCIREKDPQVLNILNFIKSGNNLEAQLEKLNRGMDQLRKEIAVSDPMAKKCPLCKARKVYQESINGKRGWMCYHCKIGYQGAGIFYFDGKNYNISQARKLIKMKAFS